jgi:uridine kinase
MNRSTLLESVSRKIALLGPTQTIRVAIDGVDGAGKTTFADELVDPLRALGLSAIRASIDGFHNPRSVRYRFGRSSPMGYFRDSFNYAAPISHLLAALAAGRSQCFRRAVFDYRTDSEIIAPAETAPPHSVLLFDGVFLLRPELLPYWDFSVFLAAPFHVTVPRMAHRDGRSADVDAPEKLRYVEGQKLYLQSCNPKRLASLIIDNTDPAFPEIMANA